MFQNMKITKTIYLIIYLLQFLFTINFTNGECNCKLNKKFSNLTFPKKFLFGVVTSAYQIEGAWNVDGKGMNMWDNFTHAHPDRIADHSNGDDACKSYYKYKEDITHVHELCCDVYRFSISWSRILPDGTINNINRKGVEFYHKFIDEILCQGIQPMVTIYHTDLPQALVDKGGWLNRSIVQHFASYSDLLFKLYGHKVKMWLTINEGKLEQIGYGSEIKPPGTTGHGVDNYIAGHNILLAHAAAYRLYEKKYKHKQKGLISIITLTQYCLPKCDTKTDNEAIERFLQFYIGWFAHPIYSKEGDYPKVMREYIDRNSALEGRNESRLPRFTKEEIKFIRGTFDFFALTYFITQRCTQGTTGKDPSWERDTDVVIDPIWPTTDEDWFKTVPEGFIGVMNWIKKEYGNHSIFMVENGYITGQGLNDEPRINFIYNILKAVVKSIELGFNIWGYTVWSLMDTFEGIGGYRNRFGLIDVNMTDPNRPRKKKKSALFYKSLIQNHKCTL